MIFSPRPFLAADGSRWWPHGLSKYYPFYSFFAKHVFVIDYYKISLYHWFFKHRHNIKYCGFVESILLIFCARLKVRSQRALFWKNASKHLTIIIIVLKITYYWIPVDFLMFIFIRIIVIRCLLRRCLVDYWSFINNKHILTQIVYNL